MNGDITSKTELQILASAETPVRPLAPHTLVRLGRAN